MIKNLENAFSVNNKNVLITGGNRGVGKGISVAMAQCGANVAIMARDEETSKQTVKKISEYGGKHKFYYGDITDLEGAREVVNEVIKDYEKIDVLVNNAGIARHFEVLQMDDDLSDWYDVINVNLNGTFNMCYLVGKKMKKSKDGSIINISSNAAEIVNKPQFSSSYNSSKAAMNMLTKCLAEEWTRYGIRVNAIAPGYTDTDLTDGSKEEGTESHKDFWLSQMPADRFNKPIEIGALAVFLASEAAEQIVGTINTIDGGYMLAT